MGSCFSLDRCVFESTFVLNSASQDAVVQPLFGKLSSEIAEKCSVPVDTVRRVRCVASLEYSTDHVMPFFGLQF
jgi:hypothetical protein